LTTLQDLHCVLFFSLVLQYGKTKQEHTLLVCMLNGAAFTRKMLSGGRIIKDASSSGNWCICLCVPESKDTSFLRTSYVAYHRVFS